MGDVGDHFRHTGKIVTANKEKRRQENLSYLADHTINWKWIDQASDHILIDGNIDYYLGKTYWFNRRTKARGYTMLHKLMGR